MAKRWLVTWEIDDEDADTPEAAAASALDHIVRPDSLAHVFVVTDADTGETEIVDLDRLNASPV